MACESRFAVGSSARINGEVAGGGAHCVWLRRFHKKDTERESEEREGQFQLASAEEAEQAAATEPPAGWDMTFAVLNLLQARAARASKNGAFDHRGVCNEIDAL